MGWLVVSVLGTLGPLVVGLLWLRLFPGMPRTWWAATLIGAVLIGGGVSLWSGLAGDWVAGIVKGVFALGMWLLVVSQAWAIKAYGLDRNGQQDAPDT